MNISKQERIEMARDAEAQIAEAIENLKQAVAGLPCEANHKAYLICGLECAIGAGGWLSGDPTIEDLISDIEEQAEV